MTELVVIRFLVLEIYLHAIWKNRNSALGKLSLDRASPACSFPRNWFMAKLKGKSRWKRERERVGFIPNARPRTLEMGYPHLKSTKEIYIWSASRCLERGGGREKIFGASKFKLSRNVANHNQSVSQRLADKLCQQNPQAPQLISVTMAPGKGDTGPPKQAYDSSCSSPDSSNRELTCYSMRRRDNFNSLKLTVF